jgi:hypothetical protein
LAKFYSSGKPLNIKPDKKVDKLFNKNLKGPAALGGGAAAVGNPTGVGPGAEGDPRFDVSSIRGGFNGYEETFLIELNNNNDRLVLRLLKMRLLVFYQLLKIKLYILYYLFVSLARNEYNSTV